MVGKYSADFYSLNGLCIESHKRREHLSPEDLLKNKQMVESLTKGGGGAISPSGGAGGTMPGDPPIRRSTLTPPEPPDVTWEDYIGAEAGSAPVIARERKSKHNSKSFRATVAMVSFCNRMCNRSVISIKGLLDYAIKISATWVACKKLQPRIARPITLRIQHQAIFKRVSVI